MDDDIQRQEVCAKRSRTQVSKEAETVNSGSNFQESSDSTLINELIAKRSRVEAEFPSADFRTVWRYIDGCNSPVSVPDLIRACAARASKAPGKIPHDHRTVAHAMYSYLRLRAGESAWFEALIDAEANLDACSPLVASLACGLFLGLGNFHLLSESELEVELRFRLLLVFHKRMNKRTN